MTEGTDSVSQYFKSMHEVVKEASREEMYELWKRAKRGDRRAKKRIMELNLRLVIPTAKKYYRPGTELMDLIEEGNLGLLHAIDKFDPQKGYRFSTYATYWIEQYIRRAVEEQTGTIRIPPHAWESLRQWLKQWDILHGQLGRDPTLSEMANEMQWSARQIKAVMEASEAAKGIGSLGSPLSGDEDSLTLEDTIVDTQSGSPDEVLGLLRMHEDFNKALEMIGEREKSILEYRYGLSGQKPMTLEEIGQTLKLSRERVRQIEERAVLRLRKVAQRMGIIEINELRASTPNLHIGQFDSKHHTDILGAPTVNNPLRKLKKQAAQHLQRQQKKSKGTK
ncbi:MAG: sigma-70 family RNA polymerase sigma factor [Elusimicrobiaceae bacterium]|nr:sigma-70 family RNA polymerase sigma factor [Elusimicrobiaceae bacterium]